ncbi:hypothetical protein FHU29_001632 [Hoyosella altamirensis]|uniref:Uncharacterized protein n=1 Tax=Hoyosella altamirensis TaxID=616997 RepID=A0A839RLX4_9ACTN|nr:hypothetical protein [Hoyosella altamirensis]
MADPLIPASGANCDGLSRLGRLYIPFDLRFNADHVSHAEASHPVRPVQRPGYIKCDESDSCRGLNRDFASARRTAARCAVKSAEQRINYLEAVTTPAGARFSTPRVPGYEACSLRT